MNCKITHDNEEIVFRFDLCKSTNTQTLIYFNKETKKFQVKNTEEFYGYGNTMSVKEFNYCVKYLTKGGFL